jgi:LPS sulfotransferase NodH
MIITILAEPRSGSTNLANWFRSNKEFTVLVEPYSPHASDYKKEKKLGEWDCKTPHSLIKLVYPFRKGYDDSITRSDKIIVLHRENKKEHAESWLAAMATGNWSKQWYSSQIHLSDNTPLDSFYELKDRFEREYLNNVNFFKISYEELYYNNGFQKVVDYVNLDCVKNENFPYGQKYRINLVPNKLF